MTFAVEVYFSSLNAFRMSERKENAIFLFDVDGTLTLPREVCYVMNL